MAATKIVRRKKTSSKAIEARLVILADLVQLSAIMTERLAKGDDSPLDPRSLQSMAWTFSHLSGYLGSNVSPSVEGLPPTIRRRILAAWKNAGRAS